LKDDPNEWLRKLVGDKRVMVRREESRALPSWQYGDPADNLDRIRAERKAEERRLMKAKNGGNHR
jgi:hypothetical protein